MNSRTNYYGMILLLVVLVIGIFGGTYLASQRLQQQSAKLVDFKAQAQVLDTEQAGLVKAKKDVATYTELEKIARIIVPQDKDQATAIREIVKIAGASGIKPTAINFPASTLGNSIVAGSKDQLSQLTVVPGLPGVYKLPITVQVDNAAAVPYSKFIDFVGKLEQNRRTAQVTSIVLQPSTDDRTMVSFTLTIDEFIKP